MPAEDPNRKGILRFDGGSRGNPGLSASGFVIEVDGETVLEEGRFLGRATNNEAEYDGLIRGLQRAAELHLDCLIVLGDSELVIRQLTGRYKVRAGNLKKLHKKAALLTAGFKEISFRHVAREENAAADRIMNRALGERADVME